MVVWLYHGRDGSLPFFQVGQTLPVTALNHSSNLVQLARQSTLLLICWLLGLVVSWIATSDSINSAHWPLLTILRASTIYKTLPMPWFVRMPYAHQFRLMSRFRKMVATSNLHSRHHVASLLPCFLLFLPLFSICYFT